MLVLHLPGILERTTVTFYEIAFEILLIGITARLHDVILQINCIAFSERIVHLHCFIVSKVFLCWCECSCMGGGCAVKNAAQHPTNALHTAPTSLKDPALNHGYAARNSSTSLLILGDPAFH